MMEIGWVGLFVVFLAGLIAGMGWGLAAGRGDRKDDQR